MHVKNPPDYFVSKFAGNISPKSMHIIILFWNFAVTPFHLQDENETHQKKATYLI